MNYIGLNTFDTANGEGVRVSLFVSGCSIHCKGCFNKASWDFNAGKPFTEETQETILKALDSPDIAGFSLLGGEPFEKAHEETLVKLLSEIRKKLKPEQNVWAWTGYEWGAIKDSPLLQYIDRLIVGPFEKDLADRNLKYMGSSNQRIINLWML